jgi:transposase
MRPYSKDLRERVIAALEAGQDSQAEIAETFAVSLSTVEKWWRSWRETGRRTALPHAGGEHRALQGCAASLRAEVKKRPDVTLVELCARVAEAEGVKASPSMMCRELRRVRLPRKKSPSTTANGIRHG